MPFLLLFAGLVMLLAAAELLVRGASRLAASFGVSPLVVGLTVVAFGTSAPELVVSVSAAASDQSNIALGNVVGSNVFNLLAVMGAAALVAPDGVTVAPTALRFDILVMIAAAVACLPIVFTGAVIARWEGLLFLGYYGAYVAFVVLSARAPDLAPYFGRIMLFFVIPLTVVTLAAMSAAAWLGRRSSRS